MLTPEDKKTLLDFAGPLFAESKELDSMYYNDSKPKVDGIPDSGIAGGFQSALERDFALSQAHHRVQQSPQMQYDANMRAALAHQPFAHNAPSQPLQPQADPNQLEFRFDSNLQEKTNALLETQNKLIKELIKKLDVVVSHVSNNEKIQS